MLPFYMVNERFSFCRVTSDEKTGVLRLRVEHGVRSSATVVENSNSNWLTSQRRRSRVTAPWDGQIQPERTYHAHVWPTETTPRRRVIRRKLTRDGATGGRASSSTRRLPRICISISLTFRPTDETRWKNTTTSPGRSGVQLCARPVSQNMGRGTASVRSSHQTVPDYTLRQRFPNTQQSRFLIAWRRLEKLVLPSIFDTSLSSLMMRNLQSYPTTVLNERMRHF